MEKTSRCPICGTENKGTLYTEECIGTVEEYYQCSRCGYNRQMCYSPVTECIMLDGENFREQWKVLKEHPEELRKFMYRKKMRIEEKSEITEDVIRVRDFDNYQETPGSEKRQIEFVIESWFDLPVRVGTDLKGCEWLDLYGRMDIKTYQVEVFAMLCSDDKPSQPIIFPISEEEEKAIRNVVLERLQNKYHQTPEEFYDGT